MMTKILEIRQKYILTLSKVLQKLEYKTCFLKLKYVKSVRSVSS